MEINAGGMPKMRLLSAYELLCIRREAAAMECADEQERSLWCNALVLASCCDEFSDARDVLTRLSARQMERCLLALLREEDSAEGGIRRGEENASFDEERFCAMKKEGVQ